MKTIDILRKSTPEINGFPDALEIFDAGEVLFSGFCGSCCNPFQPSTNKKWFDAYACLSEQVMEAACVNHDKFGKCLLINKGGRCKTINPNKNHEGLYIATEIFVHRGDSDSWRGSRGCITIPPNKWVEFMSFFALNEGCRIIIRRDV